LLCLRLDDWGHRPQSVILSECRGGPGRIAACNDRRFHSADGIPLTPGQDGCNGGHAAVASPFQRRHSVYQLIDGRALSHPALDDVVVVVIVVVVIVLGVGPNAVDVVVVIIDAHASVAARSRSANAMNVARRGGGAFWRGTTKTTTKRRGGRRNDGGRGCVDERGGGGCDNDCHRCGASRGRRWASSLLHYFGKGRDD
jgi:hypothetical protein